MKAVLAAAAALALFAVPVARADPAAISLSGPVEQGALVIGHVPAGARLTLDGAPVEILPDGRFLLGFGRDAGPRAELVATLPDGRTIRRALDVAQRQYRIQRITGLPPKMVTPPPEVLAHIRHDIKEVATARQVRTPTAFFDTGFIWPAHGPITGVYGSQRILNGKPRRPHFGVDIAAPKGSPVVATADGIVRVADHDMYYTGGTVVIDHGYGVNTAYLHMQTVVVKVGEPVRQGQEIGTVGAAGRATGPHLDWRVNLYGTRLDPALLVPPMTAEEDR